jgi:M6 family metalloprotease-like protein
VTNSFTIISGNDSGDFNISSRGVITTAKALDYETTRSYALVIKATNLAGDSNSVTLNINVINVLDIVPVLDNTTLSIEENTTIGAKIGLITIKDVGDSPITDINLSGVGSEYFEVSSDGNITLKLALDYESRIEYNLSAIATSGAGSSNSVKVNIGVTNVVDVVPLLATPPSSTVLESATVGTTVATIETNGTTPDENVTNSFTIISGNDSGDFNISSRGVITTAKALDYNRTQSYILTIKATNVAGDSRTVNAVIMVVKETKILPLLIIRIEFNDYNFTSSATVWHSKIFGNNESELNHYYNEISYGTFKFQEAIESDDIANDGIITVHLNENHPGNSNNEFLTRINNAVALADNSIDFSAYDTNRDGAISKDELQLMYLVAGGESATGTNPGIWAHAWCMYGGNAEAPTHDGVKLMNCSNNGGYSRFGERHGSHDATIGIIAHELGHAVFNLPDLYDTEGGDSEGIGNFGLMGSGNWTYKNGDIFSGETPIHMTSWSKYKAGFTIPTVIDINQSGLNIKGASFTDYKFYRIETKRLGEYFLLENRASNGYDRGFYALSGSGDYMGGLLILHIDENQANNQDVNHKMVDVEEANDIGLDDKSHRGHYNNLFFDGNSNRFTSTTTPDSKRYDGVDSNISITNISTVGDTMTLDISVN